MQTFGDQAMMTLPASNAEVLAQVINPALDVLPAKMASDAARCMLLAIGRQESNFGARVQGGGGPAHGLWQFEMGGVSGVLNHPASQPYVRRVCALMDIAPTAGVIYAALPGNDILAAIIARLLLWTDADPLPAIGDIDGAWKLYAVDLWRPGKPSRTRWNNAYSMAEEALA